MGVLTCAEVFRHFIHPGMPEAGVDDMLVAIRT